MDSLHNNLISENHPVPVTGFSHLARNALWGMCLNIKEHVIATHQELAILRRCATVACEKPDQVIHVLSANKSKHTNYIVKTLIHFGVSCGQINVSAVGINELTPKGIWLFVENRQPVC